MVILNEVIGRSAHPPTTTLRVVEVDANHGKAVLGNMLLAVWRKETTLPAFQRMDALIQEILGQHPKGVGVLQAIEKTAVPPDADTKREFVRNAQQGEGRVVHFSVVHEATGFHAAIVRAIMSGVYMFARPKFPHMVFSSLADAAAWHVQQQRRIAQPAFSEAELVSAVHALQSYVSSHVEGDELRY